MLDLFINLLFVSDYWINVNLSGYVIKKKNRSFHDAEILNLLLISRDRI